MKETVDYIMDFLACYPVSKTGIVHYDMPQNSKENVRLIIIPAFPNFNITSLPTIPFQIIDNVPILFGKSKIEKVNNIIIIYADIIISTFYLLSRYEEILKPECRDKHGRFLAKDSVVFQQNYGKIPLVDQYSILFRNWLRDIGVDLSDKKTGFNKVYLTHDIDEPFYFRRFSNVYKQYIKNLLNINYSERPLKKYLDEGYDEYYTFPRIINYDNTIKKSVKDTKIKVIYFIISAGTCLNKNYYNFSSRKTNRLFKLLRASGAELGLHVSYEAGIKPEKVKFEAKLLKDKFHINNLLSRHHFLQWREPDDVSFLECAGITDDFTLSYADSIGFRVGTCRPYLFINPKTKKLTKVTIHPLEIMDCTLSLSDYMHLDYEDALGQCKDVIAQVHKHNGELVILWHNTEFTNKGYHEKLYNTVLDYIKEIA